MPQDKTLAALGYILIYATVIGFTDNYVRIVAAEGGLWQFHAMRSVMALSLLAIVAAVFAIDLRPRSLRAVAARSLIHGLAMLIYFGALGFLPVAQVAAGLFTAPIFVLLIARFVFAEPIGPVRVIAVAIGFLGVLLVLGREAMSGASIAAVVPVLAGAFYALGNIATRRWCADETAGAMLAGFFVALGLLGFSGMAVLALVPVTAPDGAAGFVLRGLVWPSVDFLFWTFVQAMGSLFAVAMMIRGYQAASATRVSVFEYVLLPISAIWGWLLWDETLSAAAVAGMALITAAGALIAVRSVQSPIASRQ